MAPEQAVSAILPREIELGLEALRGPVGEIFGYSPGRLAAAIGELDPAVRADTVGALRALTKLAATIEPLLAALRAASQKPEIAVAPAAHEPSCLDLRRSVLLLKRSKVEFDMWVRGVGEEDLKAQYRKENVDVEKIFASHDDHWRSIEALMAVYRRAGVEPRAIYLHGAEESQVKAALADSDLVVSLGGDDHFKQVAQLVTTQYVAVLNSDVVRSVGALTNFKSDEFQELFERLQQGKFLIEPWVRIQAIVELWENGNKREIELPPAVSELSVADMLTQYTMRGVVGADGEEFDLKGSGLLVSNGTGSTGWYRSATRYLYPGGSQRWNRTEPRLEWAVREPYGDYLPTQRYSGEILAGQEIVVTSSSNHRPEVVGDSVATQALPRGGRVHIRIAPEPLRVISRRVPES